MRLLGAERIDQLGLQHVSPPPVHFLFEEGLCDLTL